jgi:hypothetical protein
MSSKRKNGSLKQNETGRNNNYNRIVMTCRSVSYTSSRTIRRKRKRSKDKMEDNAKTLDEEK